LREDGALEYTICFSVCKDNATSVTFVSRWGLDEYPSQPVFFNYQVWAEAPHITQKIVEEIIAKFRGQFANINTATEGKIPAVYVRNGFYDNGFLTLKIYNPTQAKSLIINGNSAPTETLERLPFNHKIALNGEEEETVKIFVGSVFDMGFKLKADNSEASDALYFADGVWAVDYNKNASKIDKFDVNNTIPTNETALYTLERDPILKGQVKDYVSMFRTLRPAGTVTNVSNFKNLSFRGSGTEVVEVTLIKKSVTDWSKQYRTEVRLEAEAKVFNIALADFSNGTSETMVADDLTSIVFTVKGDGQNVKTFEMNLQNVAFDNKDYKKVTLTNGIAVTPNPVVEVANVNFKMEDRGTALITLSNVNGQTMMTKNEIFAKGNNDVKLDMTGYPSGIYVLNVISARGTLKTKIVIP
jgi:Secretion system C-terminal sorting domain